RRTLCQLRAGGRPPLAGRLRPAPYPFAHTSCKELQMLKRSTDAIAKWKGFDNAIDRWLDERHQLIVKLSEFASDRDLSGNGSPARLQDFLSLLSYYVSAGPSEFHQRLREEGTQYAATDA